LEYHRKERGTNSCGGGQGGIAGAGLSKIRTEIRRKDEWRKDVSHPDIGTASLWGMAKTPTAH
jgi:hypothetical protein